MLVSQRFDQLLLRPSSGVLWPLNDLDVDGVAPYVSYFLKVPVVNRNRTRFSMVIGHDSNHSTIEADIVMELGTWCYLSPGCFL